MRTPSAEIPRVPVPCQSGQGEPVPKVRPKGVADGKHVKNHVLEVCDGSHKLSRIIGFLVVVKRFQERAPSLSRTRNRHRWEGRVYQGVERTMVKELGKLHA